MLPQLSSEAQALFRFLAAVLTAATLLLALPQWRRFFLSERWGGYAQSRPEVDAIHNPVVFPVVFAVWLSCTALLAIGQWSVPAALVNLMLCHYFFISMRWKGVLRGMGAPGYMTYWLAACVFLLELTQHHAPALRSVAVLVVQVDFALIILAAGVYKFTAGYPRNEGMELGMVNPEWGYWWRHLVHLPPGHWVFRFLNHLAWSTEVAAAVLMLVPPVREWGGLLIILSFAFIRTIIRLGVLCEIVMLCGLLYLPAGSAGDQLIKRVVDSNWAQVAPGPALPQWLVTALGAAMLLYLALLPLAYAGLNYNFYARRSLPQPLQRLLERYTNFFGMILWRVFSVDVVNFFVQIYRQPGPGGDGRVLISKYGWPHSLRFSHVAESVTITSIFTTLKYYPSNTARFTERLLRYARTLPCPPGQMLVFEYVSIDKTPSRFAFEPLAEFTVDPHARTVTRRDLTGRASAIAPHKVSPVHEGAQPGSYAPLPA